MPAAATVLPGYEIRGGVADLWYCTDPEIMVEGPANTGKSRGWAERIYRDAKDNPGCRIAVVRKTRVSLTESFLVTWEDKVLDFHGETFHRGVNRGHRESYKFPCSGATVVPLGMDNPTRLYSSEWDLIYVQELVELNEHEWESLHRGLRNGKLRRPLGGGKSKVVHILGGDTNPGPPTHWANQRALKGKLKRILSRHEDNPTITTEQLERLRNLTGVRRKWLYEGVWAAADGQVWENFDPSVHVISASQMPSSPSWAFGAMDFGWRSPGCFQVWGVDGERRLYRLAEVYRRGWTLEQWADAIGTLHKEYELSAIVADSAEPRSIEFLNDVLAPGRAVPFVRPADKTKGRLHGYNLVRSGLAVQSDGSPRMLLLRDALRFGRDPDLAERSQPCCFEEEIPALVFPKRADGTPSKDEVPDRNCADHAADTACYAAVFAWEFDLGDPGIERPRKVVPPGSAGYDDRIWEVFPDLYEEPD